jgi:hypothetical protein
VFARRLHRGHNLGALGQRAGANAIGLRQLGKFGLSKGVAA